MFPGIKSSRFRFLPVSALPSASHHQCRTWKKSIGVCTLSVGVDARCEWTFKAETRTIQHKTTVASCPDSRHKWPVKICQRKEQKVHTSITNLILLKLQHSLIASAMLLCPAVQASRPFSELDTFDSALQQVRVYSCIAVVSSVLKSCWVWVCRCRQHKKELCLAGSCAVTQQPLCTGPLVFFPSGFLPDAVFWIVHIFLFYADGKHFRFLPALRGFAMNRCKLRKVGCTAISISRSDTRDSKSGIPDLLFFFREQIPSLANVKRTSYYFVMQFSNTGGSHLIRTNNTKWKSFNLGKFWIKYAPSFNWEIQLMTSEDFFKQNYDSDLSVFGLSGTHL